MTDEWDEFAADWDTDPSARAYAAAAFESLQAILTPAGVSLDRARVLDFGCGTGLLTERLVAAGAVVLAVDRSVAMLAELTAKIDRNGWTNVTTSDRLPEGPADIDVVVCSSVCAFVDDYPATAAELVSRLRPSGHFVQWDWERHDGDEHGLTRPEIHAALLRAGLVDVAVGTAFSIDLDGHTMAPLVGAGRRPTERLDT